MSITPRFFFGGWENINVQYGHSIGVLGFENLWGFATVLVPSALNLRNASMVICGKRHVLYGYTTEHENDLIAPSLPS